MSNSYLAFPEIDPVMFSIGKYRCTGMVLCTLWVLFLHYGWLGDVPQSLIVDGQKMRLKIYSMLGS